ncbi:MAG: DNA primase small subunit domain-containing protein [Candidatus Diapherotrites archaeon]|nr:DNA primase small subunit domain-containing protein [Candidatus Diapherotrites archaeon]
MTGEMEFVAERFKRFYTAHPVSEPPDVASREFGYGVWGKKISSRHGAFSSAAEFNRFLQSTVPFFVSYSSAYYQFPDRRPMEAKIWLKSDLIYEFDADDFKLPCAQDHDFWGCKSCHATGRGVVSACSSCGGASIATDQWVCPKCLTAVKEKVLLLCGVLETDFGLTDGVLINFSGSKGFHVHVRSKNVWSMPARGRVELLDYLTGTNLDLPMLGFAESKTGLSTIPFPRARGWSKKLLTGLKTLLDQQDASRISEAGGNEPKKTGDWLVQNRESVWSSISKGVFPQIAPKSMVKSAVFWKNALESVADTVRLPVDRSTSLDQYKVVRVPETLHGSTGLLAAKVDFNMLSEYNALRESVVFSDSAQQVWVSRAPKFELGNESFGPFENEWAQVPEYAAVFLLCHGAARLSENKTDAKGAD